MKRNYLILTRPYSGRIGDHAASYGYKDRAVARAKKMFREGDDCLVEVRFLPDWSIVYQAEKDRDGNVIVETLKEES